ncbi:MAG TPA: penicillin-binding transpeptidase domain-containing protein, partial [Thermoanaerobaculia bacterium]|nr:penicillin-binding transpeptidase domain-containing protein [Thermoanaerobaculia bacterium]
EWDPVRAPREAFWSDAWSQGQDLESAFRRSAVWYYQELARRVGGERMQRELDELDYGNRDISGGIDRFWLGSSLALSADEQVAVLRRIFGGETHFASEHVALLRQLMARREPEGVHWGHKTGACPAGDAWVGWLVGWVADDDGRLIALFAMNLEGPDHAAIAAPRIPLARRVLAEKGLLAPAEGPGR